MLIKTHGHLVSVVTVCGSLMGFTRKEFANYLPQYHRFVMSFCNLKTARIKMINLLFSSEGRCVTNSCSGLLKRVRKSQFIGRAEVIYSAFVHTHAHICWKSYLCHYILNRQAFCNILPSSLLTLSSWCYDFILKPKNIKQHNLFSKSTITIRKRKKWSLSLGQYSFKGS